MTYGRWFLIVITFSLACSTSPLGRKQLLLLPDSQLDQMGVQAFQQMKQEIPVSTDPQWNGYVSCVALPITEAAKGQTAVEKWEIVVFKDPSANAFALPGGKVGVHTGLFKVAKTDGQLAAVIGHEVGHVIAKHGNERVSENVVAQFGLTAVGALTQNNPHSGLIMAALGVGTQVGVLLPFSRNQESESDVIGLDLMARAGFDPRESVELWKNMTAAAGGTPPEFLSTHPSGKSRINELNENMSHAIAKFDQAKKSGRAAHCLPPQ